jgi:uncharacterized protein
MPYKSTADLPPDVKKLPAHGQDIFRKAFNSAYEQYDGDESRAHATAWSAVRNVYKKQGSQWVAKAGDSTTDSGVVIIERMEMDAAANVRLTGDGYLVAEPRVARSGIQVYQGWELGRPEVQQVRVYRPADEVFSPEAMASFAHKPVTLDHPTEAVSAKNWRKHAVGWTGDRVARDGDYIRVPMILTDAQVIAAVQGGKRELSAGYAAKFIWGAGTTDDGQEYDARQAAIRDNHVAVCDKARGGPMLRLGDSFAVLAEDDESEDRRSKRSKRMDPTLRSITVDGISCEMTDTAAQVVQRAIAAADQARSAAVAQAEQASTARQAADAKVGELTTQVGSLTGEVAALKKQLEDAKPTPASIDKLVAERSDVVGRAIKLLGPQFTPDGKTNVDIQRMVVAARMTEPVARAMSDAEVAGAFRAFTAEAASAPPATALAATWQPPGTTFHRPQDAAAAAWEERNKLQAEAYKKGGQAAA